MPELPEVETIRRQLEPELEGQRIVAARILDERWSRPARAEAVEKALTGRRIEVVERRGKYLLVGLDDGATLLMHLRMTGNIVIADADEEQRLGGERLYPPPDGPAHLRAELVLEDGRLMRFIDARRFGHGAVLGAEELDAHLSARLGVEPLEEELTAAHIGQIAAGRTVPLKSFLLDQKGIAGIGNIYADEALHGAALHPLSPAGSMKPEHWEALREGIISSLELGLLNGGASIDDYRDARGEKGSMQDEFLVHTREGLPCPRCEELIERIVVGGRSTYFCPACQLRLRRRPRRRAAVRGRRA